MNPEELFNKLINNKISREEFEQLVEGISDEEIKARYEAYLYDQFEKEVKQHSLSEGGMKISKAAKLNVSRNEAKQASRFSLTVFSYRSIAAAVLVLVGLAFSTLFILSQYKSDSPLTNFTESTHIHKETKSGQKLKMTLQDGTFMHLNSASIVNYPENFGEDSREVEVLGEVFFDVERDESRPFKIKVKDYMVTVLGTSFNIQAYEDEQEFSVTVESGKVQVAIDESGNTAILERGQKLHYNPTTNITEIVEVSSGRDLGWRMGILEFDRAPMTKVERMIERWYGVDLHFEDAEIYKTSYSGTHHNENLEAVLEVLTFNTRMKYVIEDDSIIFKN